MSMEGFPLLIDLIPRLCSLKLGNKIKTNIFKYKISPVVLSFLSLMTEKVHQQTIPTCPVFDTSIKLVFIFSPSLVPEVKFCTEARKKQQACTSSCAYCHGLSNILHINRCKEKLTDLNKNSASVYVSEPVCKEMSVLLFPPPTGLYPLTCRCCYPPTLHTTPLLLASCKILQILYEIYQFFKVTLQIKVQRV